MRLVSVASPLALVLALSPACRKADSSPRDKPSAASSADTPSAASPATSSSSASATLTGASTHVVVAGVLSFADPSLAPFAPAKRKDAELAELFAKRGIPKSQITTLLDKKATASAVRSAIHDAAARVPAGDTLFVYYAGHGGHDAKGRTHFMASDTQTKDLAQTGISLDALADDLIASFHGKRVVLMADCCYSGSLREVATKLRERRGVEVASVTSSESSNSSTGNWTFTQALIDGFSGDPLSDRDGDGRVTLEELNGEISDAMKFREHQKHGSLFAGVPTSEAIATGVGPRPAGKGPHAIGAYLEAQDEDTWRPVRVRDSDGAKSTARFYFYNHAEDRSMSHGDLRPMRFVRYPVGKDIQVYWKKKLWNARVTRADGDFHFITYTDFGPEWDEWVASDRIADKVPIKGSVVKGSAGERIEVEWRGVWYPADVLEKSDTRALVHYVGFAESWDEWVPKDRQRPLAR